MANVTPDTQEDQDRAYSPEELRRRELEHESIPGYDHSSNGLGDHPISAGVADAEENPEPPQTEEFTNNYTGKKKKHNTPFLEGKGPLLAITGGLGLGGIALIVFLVPSILLFHLLANMFDTMDPSSTALSKVAQITLINKLGSGSRGATVGCDTIKIACRFKTPSNELLRQLRNNGIVPLDSGGNEMVIDTKSKWPTEKPSAYRVSSFHTEAGETITVAAKDLKSALASNSGFRIAFNKVVKKLSVRAFSRFSPAFLQVIERFKLNLRNPLGEKAPKEAEDAGRRTLADALEEAVIPEGGDTATPEKSAASLASRVSLRVNKLLTLVAKTSRGSGVVLAMALQCMANQIPGMVKKALVSIQEGAMVAAGSQVVNGMSAAKAGDASPETVSDIGDAWTNTDADGNSALSSAGAHYALYQEKDTSKDPTYQNVTPAAFGDLLNNLDIADKILANPVSNAGCNLLMNPVTGAAVAAGINAAFIGSTSIETFGASFVVNLVLGVSFSVLINGFSDTISNAVGDFIAPGFGAIAKPTISKLAQPHQTFGNVVTSTVGALGSANGGATFGTYLTTDELSTYSQAMREQRLADAEFDRATLSPFDASSRYTFLGSIVNQFMPYYGSLSTVNGGVSAFFNFIPQSFASLLGLSSASAATDPASVYKDACPTPEDITTPEGKILGADLFCHPVAAMNIPDDWDPSASEAAVSSQIDPDTGEPLKGDDSALAKTFDEITSFGGESFTVTYADWYETCSDPENATQCTGGDATQTNYGLYTAAKTAVDMWDADFSSDESTDTTDSETPASDGTDTSTSSDTSAPEAVFNNLYNPNSTNNLTDTVAAQSITNVLQLVSTAYDVLKAYNTSLFASTTNTVLNQLQRFTLWR